MSEWISVKDRLPEEGQIVLSIGHEYNKDHMPYFYAVPRFLCGEFYCRDGGDDWSVKTYTTHWQPLPAFPD